MMEPARLFSSNGTHAEQTCDAASSAKPVRDNESADFLALQGL